MSPKLRLYLLALVTLVVFPIPTFVYRIFWKSESFGDILPINELFSNSTIYGLAIGIGFGLLVLEILKRPTFKAELDKQRLMIKSFNLNYLDAFLLSICAGVGEELLFRAGIQIGLGPILTTLLFIAIHGYFSFKSWKDNVYGIVLIPFILLLAFGYNELGIWFCISAHFAYDWVFFNENIH